MYCRHCGKPIEENATYCGHCGKQINKEVVKTKDNSDIPAETFFKPKFSLFELSIVKLLGFILILSAVAVIGGSFLSSNHLSNAMQPPFLLIPLVFIFGLCVVFVNSYNLALLIGLTFFFLIIYFIPNPLTGGFFYFAKLMVSIYQNNNQRLSSLITYSGSLIAIVTCCYLTTVGILSQRDSYSHSKKRGLVSVCILTGFLLLFAILPFTRKINAGSVSNTGVGGLSPGDIFINSSTAMEGITRTVSINHDSGSNRWVYEFKIENKRNDGKETIIDKIISNRGEVPLNEENIKAQGAILKGNQIIIPINTPIVLTIYSPEPFYNLRIHTDKLEVDFLFIN
jgi:hypothetical protein